ncbi:MAG: glycosyltransferase [Deltaproteobacteria bacterium]|nr:glycosyltransferase [Deltaproteobacteria bacterium]
MKVLIVTPFFPYVGVPHAGGKTVYEIIKGLYAQHEIYLFSRIEPHEIGFVQEMGGFCKEVELYKFKTPDADNPLRVFFIIASYLNLAIRANRIIRKRNFDIVQVEHTEAGLFIKRHKKARMILDAHDVISKPAERQYRASQGVLQKTINWLRWRISKSIELSIAGKFDTIFTRSRMDKNILLSFNPNLNIHVIPHAVETSEYPPHCAGEENIILFAGAMHRDVNQEAVIYFFKNILPRVKQGMPGIQFYVVGNNPPQHIKDLSSYDRNIVVTGYVDDIAPYYQKATIFVSPILRGGGIIAKNIEAMAHSLPVVTTSIGNEGIEAVPGRDILVADTAEEFSQNISLLLKSRDMRIAVGEAGRRFVRESFDLKRMIEKVDMIWRKTLP